ncbi:hypothetical protein ACHHYP_20537 [Achlya hypogyna]|uniref:Uncharacterized protein n=1 Tax=Achlya hypogyna TaxID=1202772 RepID=A0A1V9YJD9_ACHHY|nr:hypothetical protein ACHHYP_20537 [Achlya hypogyna]
MLVLVGRDGDNRNDWFLSSCLKNDVQLEGPPILCGRGTATLASKWADLKLVHCTRHLVMNGPHLRSTSQDDQDCLRQHLSRLGLSLPSAAAYYNKIDPTIWAIYPHIHITLLYGWRTANFVESTNSEALPARDMDPFHFLLHYMEDMMTTAYTHRTKAHQWVAEHHIITPYGKQILDAQQAQAPRHKIREYCNRGVREGS